MIQWYPTGGANQAWEIAGSGNGNPELPQGYIANVNRGMCLATDGVAGHQLYQEPCSPNLVRFETWNVTSDAPGMNFYNPYFGLSVDVYGNSYTAGAAIDGWSYNGQMKQWFHS